MLDHVPAWLGKALRSVRAGADKLTIAHPAIGTGLTALDLSSPAFADGEDLPVRFTTDGAGVSPPLAWGPVPVGTTRLALIVEDADAPTPNPIVHAIVWNIDPAAGGLDEGAIDADAAPPAGGTVGRNSYAGTAWLPPDPPTGHGLHRYVFQLFALGESASPDTDADAVLGRGKFVEALAGHVLAAGVLTATYARGDAVRVE